MLDDPVSGPAGGEAAGSGPALRVAVDATPLLGNPTGVGAFCAGALRGLAARRDLEVTAFAVSWRRRRGIDALVPDGVSVVGRPMPARPLHWAWGRGGLPPLEWFTGRADVVHGTNFVVPPTAGAARVATVHDLTTVRFPELCDAAHPGLPRPHPPGARARGLGAHPVRLRGRRGGGGPRRRPRAGPPVHSGVPPLPPARRRRAPAVAPRGAPTRYVLAVGTAEPRKDLPSLVRAFDQLAGDRPDLALVLCGPPGWGSDALEAAVTASAFSRRVVRTGWVDEPTLSGLLHGACVLAYPSVYEGFGFPPLQAMAAGVPVVATRAGALPEVLGDAAVLVDVGDTEALAAALAGLARHGPAARHGGGVGEGPGGAVHLGPLRRGAGRPLPRRPGRTGRLRCGSWSPSSSSAVPSRAASAATPRACWPAWPTGCWAPSAVGRRCWPAARRPGPDPLAATGFGRASLAPAGAAAHPGAGTWAWSGPPAASTSCTRSRWRRRRRGRARGPAVTVHDLAWRRLPRGDHGPGPPLARGVAAPGAAPRRRRGRPVGAGGRGARRRRHLGAGGRRPPRGRPSPAPGPAGRRRACSAASGSPGRTCFRWAPSSRARTSTGWCPPTQTARPSLPEPWPLVVVGPRGWGDVRGRPRAEARPGVVPAGPVDDGVLAALYERARLLAYVPLGEGYGMPPVEAMTFGTPVVASTGVPSVHTSDGPAALIVDAGSTDDIAGGLVAAATDGPGRDELSRRGLDLVRSRHLAGGGRPPPRRSGRSLR